MKNQANRKGFTLIELLVVIAIISTLASILFPVFSKARDKARQVVCLSNLRQINMAMQMYADDHGGSYPVSSYQKDGGPKYYYWFQAIYSYTGNLSVFTCPNDLSKTTFMPGDQFNDGVWNLNTIRNSFAFNHQLSGFGQMQIDDPTNTFVLWDAAKSYTNTDDNPVLYDRGRSKPARHTEGDNYGFADGHVTWFVRGNTPYYDPRFLPKH